MPAKIRRRMLDALGELNQIQSEKLADPETQVRIAQYEMAFRMQSSVPDLTEFPKNRKARSSYMEKMREKAGHSPIAA